MSPQYYKNVNVENNNKQNIRHLHVHVMKNFNEGKFVMIGNCHIILCVHFGAMLQAIKNSHYTPSS